MAEEAAVEETFVEGVTEPEGEAAAATGGGGSAAATATPQPNELQSAMAELARTVGEISKPKPEAPKELSEDEKAELWAVYNPEKTNPDFFKKWMRLAADMDPNEVQTTIAERKALFLEMQQGLMKQALTGARNISKIELSQLREEMSPIMEYYREAKAEATRGRFFSSYPALLDEDETSGSNRYQAVIDAVARTLADQTFPDEKAYFKALAEGAAKAIKGLVPTFDLGKNPEKKPAVTSPRLPRTRVGGTGGTAAAAATLNGGKTAESDDDSASLDFMK